MESIRILHDAFSTYSLNCDQVFVSLFLQQRTFPLCKPLFKIWAYIIFWFLPIGAFISWTRCNGPVWKKKLVYKKGVERPTLLPQFLTFVHFAAVLYFKIRSSNLFCFTQLFPKIICMLYLYVLFNCGLENVIKEVKVGIIFLLAFVLWFDTNVVYTRFYRLRDMV